MMSIFSGYSAHKVPQKAHYVFSFEGSLLLHHVKLALQGDATDHRQMIARKLLVQDGCLAHRGVGAHYRGQKVEARLWSTNKMFLPSFMAPF